MSLKIALVHITAGVDATPASPVINHLGLEIISDFLRIAGHHPVQFDSLIQKIPLGCLHKYILSENPDIVAFSLNYANWQDSLDVMGRIKKENNSIICVSGGFYATFHYNELAIYTACDYCVVGEAEGTIVALCNAFEKKDSIETIPGIAFFHDGKVVFNRPNIVTEFFLQGRPDRQLLARLEEFPEGCRKIALERSRGCYHSCSFCSIYSMQRLSGDVQRRRVRDTDELVREVIALKKNSRIRDYWFMDATFLGPENEKEKDVLLAKKLANLNDGDMNIEIDTRADTINPEVITYLKAAGVSKVFLGVESFDQGTLNLFGKGVSAERNQEAIDMLENAGIDYVLGTILFSPGKTLDQFCKEHEILKKVGYDHTQLLFRMKMYRGTRIAKDKDCDGRGISLNEDYGWDIENPSMIALWELVDCCRLALMDIVFTDLKQYFTQSKISVEQFLFLMKKTYRSMATSIDDALEALKGRALPEKGELIRIKQKLLDNVTGYRKQIIKECDNIDLIK